MKVLGGDQFLYIFKKMYDYMEANHQETKSLLAEQKLILESIEKKLEENAETSNKDVFTTKLFS